MAKTLTATVTGKIAASYSNGLDLSTPIESFQLTLAKNLTDGTGAGKAQVLASDQRTLNTGTPTEDLDLQSFPCAYGTASFTKIKTMLVSVVTTTSGANLTLEKGTANGFGGIFGSAALLTVQPNGMNLSHSGDVGYAVDASNKVLKLSTAAAECVYNIVLIGEGTVA